MTKKFKLIDSESEIPSYYRPKKTPTKKRIRLTDWQESRLEEFFYRNVYPNRMEKIAMQEEVGVPARNIRIWFQNRRARERNELEEQGEGRYLGEGRDLGEGESKRQGERKQKENNEDINHTSFF